MDITDEKKQQLKQLFPEVFREDKVDFDHLKRVLGEWVDPGKERFGLQWPGKAECMKTIQQPSVATLRPDREESVNFDETEHLFIEGDNLEVLKLLQKSYFGKVKMIYIDPPYNTGNEFIYPDNFTESLDTYLKYTGQKDAEGNWQSSNKETEGRFHSKWLNMMYPRLFLAKNLLKENGVIFISIDDHEMANLKKVCDEIFGEENFISSIIWQRAFSPKNDAKFLSDSHDYILMYSKDSSNFEAGRLERTEDQDSRYKNIDNDPRGAWASGDLTVKTYSEKYDYPIETPSGRIVNPSHGSCWRVSKEKFEELVEDNRIWFGEDGNNVPRIKRFLSEIQDGIVPTTLWLHEDVGHNQEGRQEVKKLFDDRGYFDGPKPIRLLGRIIKVANVQKEDIILDFFAGSCSAAHSVLNQNHEDGGNRKFIMVQIPEPTEEKSEARKAGFGSIADIGKERIRRVIKQIKEDQKSGKQLELKEESKKEKELDLGFKVLKLTPSNFKVWEAPGVDIEPEKLKEQLDAFSDHLNPENEKESILFELILKSGFPLTANIEKIELEGKNVFNVEDGKLMICLAEGLTFEVLDAISEKEPQRVICLDNGFTGDDADALKTNAVQLFKSKEIEFRTV